MRVYNESGYVVNEMIEGHKLWRAYFETMPNGMAGLLMQMTCEDLITGKKIVVYQMNPIAIDVLPFDIIA